MANPQNLKPIRTTERARELGRLGGKASGEARRKKADIQAAVLEMLGDGATLEQLVEAMCKEALKGNVQAAVFLRDTAGQKPVDRAEKEISGGLVVQWQK